MKGLLFLSVVGLALYTLLVLTDNSLRDGEVQTAAVTQRLSSWGSDLAPTQTSQAPSAVPQLTIPQNSVDEGQRFDPQQNSERNRSFGGEPKVQDSTIDSGTAEWAKVVLPARVHDQASVSSLTVRHYAPGVELQVVRREGVWLEVSHPASRERGWVLDKYLSSIAGPSSTRVASESITETPPIKAHPRSKKRSQSSKNAKPKEFAGWDRRNPQWNRRAERRQFRMFLLGPSFGR